MSLYTHENAYYQKKKNPENRSVGEGVDKLKP